MVSSRVRIPAPIIRYLLLVMAIGGVWACSIPEARAESDRIWAALVLASNPQRPKPPVPELVPFSGKIRKFFGYNQVELVGAAEKPISGECERWLVPSQNFWLNIKTKQVLTSGYLVDILLYQDNRCILKAEARLAPGSPLLIRGPVHARGQLIIALQVL